MRVRLAMRPYKYMRRYGPKEGKKSRKSAFLFLKSSYMIGGVCKICRIWCLAYDNQKEKCEERAKVEGKFLARTRNAHTSYSDFDFLLSQVSQ